MEIPETKSFIPKGFELGVFSLGKAGRFALRKHQELEPNYYLLG